ncbi:MAG: AMP-binding protein [Chloroflexota bacterium]|nr:AMP-binding protein [Chloroflexota bacterium]
MSTAVAGEPLLSSAEQRPRNLLELVRRSARRWPTHEALRWRPATAAGQAAASGWTSWSYAELWEQVRSVSLALGGLGLKEGDRVVILSRSRPEWLVADLASLALGAVTCPIQPSEPPARIAAQLRHLAPRLLIVENEHLLHRLRRGTESSFEVPMVGIEPLGGGEGADRTLFALAATADSAPDADERWESAAIAIEPSRLATIVHTMAEDGEPRGAMLTHGNVVHSALAATQAIPISPADVILSVLPLSHMFERGANVLACLTVGATVVFADRAMERWAADLREVRPTVMCCVPLFFDQLDRRIREQVAGRPAYARALFAWAARVGRRWEELRIAGREPPPGLRLQRLVARWAVMSRIRHGLGGRLRFFVSGGAPLRPETGRFLESVGIPVLEGYGLTETAPLLTVNRLGSHRYGTVGEPVAETEIRIAPDTDEVLARGPQVMRGYLDLPALSARMIDPDGWFHTGDRGALDGSGRLRITGRIKDLIVLATGKKVAPAAIEETLITSELIVQAVVVGEGREAVGVLIVPAEGADVAQLHREVERLTSDLAAYERPRRVANLPRPLAEASGELTADGAPRRDAVIAHFPDEAGLLFGPV